MYWMGGFYFDEYELEPKAMGAITQVKIKISQPVRRLFYSQSPEETSSNANVNM